MDRPGTIIYNEDLLNFKKQVEDATGFICYEVTPGDQSVWYGLSSDYYNFKEMLGDKFPTGTIAYCIDTGARNMYHRKSDTWFQIN